MSETKDKLKGKAMEIEGELTGDKLREAHGVALQAKGKLKGVARKVRNAASDLADAAKDALDPKEKP